MLWPTKPPDIDERICNMAIVRRSVLSRFRQMGGEITYTKKGKTTFWRVAFPDTGGAYNVHERRQDAITPSWLLDVGLSEGMPFASRLRDEFDARILSETSPAAWDSEEA